MAGSLARGSLAGQLSRPSSTHSAETGATTPVGMYWLSQVGLTASEKSESSTSTCTCGLLRGAQLLRGARGQVLDRRRRRVVARLSCPPFDSTHGGQQRVAAAHEHDLARLRTRDDLGLEPVVRSERGEDGGAGEDLRGGRGDVDAAAESLPYRSFPEDRSRIATDMCAPRVGEPTAPARARLRPSVVGAGCRRRCWPAPGQPVHASA